MKYSVSRKVSLMSLVSFSEYTNPYSTWEAEINGAIITRFPKKSRFKKSAIGVAAAFLKIPEFTHIDLTSQLPDDSRVRNIFLQCINSGVNSGGGAW